MSKETFHVAVLTPLYTGWEFLEQAALSLFLQHTRTTDESIQIRWIWLIGVNGHGPTGGRALEVADRMAQLAVQHVDPSVGQVFVKNFPDAKGKCDALNSLMQYVTAPWVALLDADDTWERDKLVTQVEALHGDAAGADILSSRCYYFGDMTSRGPELPVGWIRPEILRTVNPIINSGVLMSSRYAWWRDCQGCGLGLEDYDLWFRAAARGARMYVLDKWLVHHRIHGGSAFNSKGQNVAALRAAWAAAGTPNALKSTISVIQDGEGSSSNRVLSDAK